MFSRRFLYLSLVNLPLLASLEKKSTCGVLGCFLGAKDGDNLGEEFLVDKVVRAEFALFWGVVAGLEVEAFSCF